MDNGGTRGAAPKPTQVVAPVREVAAVADGVVVPVRSVELAFPVDGTTAYNLVRMAKLLAPVQETPAALST